MNEATLATATILIVDDHEANVAFLEQLLKRRGYERLVSFRESRAVIPYLRGQEPDLILLDLAMPYPDGFALLRELKSIIPCDHFVPVIVLTADAARETRLRTLAEGAMDFLTKPLDALEVLSRIHNLLRSRFLHKQQRASNLSLKQTVATSRQELIAANHKLEQANNALDEAYLEILSRLALAAEYHDDDSGEHTLRVARLSYLTALHLGLPSTTANLLLRAARLHDVGKIGIPDYILLKPGKLSDSEMNLMMTHCHIGARLLGESNSQLLTMAKTIARTHHERWDGKGYPLGLRAEAIPIEGRIVAIADLFDALTHDRSYRPAWTQDETIALILEEKGRSFDPHVVDAFLAALAIPSGLEPPATFKHLP